MTLESKASKYLVAALNARTLRQDMIAGNIANVDTPGYRPRDVDFETALSQASDKEINQTNSGKLQLAKTNGAHLDPEDSLTLKPRVFFRDGHLARNDGNSVDLDVETTEMSKNSVAYNAIIAAKKSDSMVFSTIIDSNGKIS